MFSTAFEEFFLHPDTLVSLSKTKMLGAAPVALAPKGSSNSYDMYPIGSMYAIYGNIYHQYTPNVSIYTIHGSYGKFKINPDEWVHPEAQHFDPYLGPRKIWG